MSEMTQAQRDVLTGEVREFTQFRCMSCGFNGPITNEEIARHRAQCAHGPTIAVKKADAAFKLPAPPVQQELEMDKLARLSGGPWSSDELAEGQAGEVRELGCDECEDGYYCTNTGELVRCSFCNTAEQHGVKQPEVEAGEAREPEPEICHHCKRFWVSHGENNECDPDVSNGTYFEAEQHGVKMPPRPKPFRMRDASWHLGKAYEIEETDAYMDALEARIRELEGE